MERRKREEDFERDLKIKSFEKGKGKRKQYDPGY